MQFASSLSVKNNFVDLASAPKSEASPSWFSAAAKRRCISSSPAPGFAGPSGSSASRARKSPHSAKAESPSTLAWEMQRWRNYSKMGYTTLPHDTQNLMVFPGL